MRPKHAPRGLRHRWALPSASAILISVICVLGITQNGFANPYPSPPPSGWPTLPPAPGDAPFYNLGYLYAGGLASAPKAATTIRQPLQLQYAPQVNYQLTYEGKSATRIVAYPFPLSPPGDPNEFGDFAPIHAQTLAFGSIPIALDLDVSLLRTSDNRPQPLHLEQITTNHQPSRSLVDPTITGQLVVGISNVTIDGVSLNVGSSCRSATPGSINATATAWFDFAHHPPPPNATTPYYFSVFTGGYLHGTLTVPAFAGCRNGSDDLDPLFNATVSGDTDLQLYTDGPWLGSRDFCYPNPPPSGLLCGPVSTLPLPTNPVHQH